MVMCVHAAGGFHKRGCDEAAHRSIKHLRIGPLRCVCVAWAPAQPQLAVLVRQRLEAGQRVGWLAHQDGECVPCRWLGRDAVRARGPHLPVSCQHDGRDTDAGGRRGGTTTVSVPSNHVHHALCEDRPDRSRCRRHRLRRTAVACACRSRIVRLQVVDQRSDFVAGEGVPEGRHGDGAIRHARWTSTNRPRCDPEVRCGQIVLLPVGHRAPRCRGTSCNRRRTRSRHGGRSYRQIRSATLRTSSDKPRGQQQCEVSALRTPG